jgi:internalin A
MPNSSLRSTWSSFETWLEQHAPAMHATLRVGTSTASTLPPELLELYALCDGQEQDQGGLFFDWYFLSGTGAAQEHSIWQSLLIGDPEVNRNIPSISHPDGAIQTAYILNGWIPFAHDGGGNHLGIDLEPGPRGVRGQVINFGRDQTDKHVLAASLEDFLSQYMACFERDEVVTGQREIMSQPVTTLSLFPKPDSPIGSSWRTVFAPLESAKNR